MNKRVKVLSTALCALLLSSNVAATNVFASSANTISNTEVSYSTSNSSDYEIDEFMWLSQDDAIELAMIKFHSDTFSDFGVALTDSGIMTSHQIKRYVRFIWRSSFGPNDANKADGVCFIITTDNRFIFD